MSLTESKLALTEEEALECDDAELVEAGAEVKLAGGDDFELVLEAEELLECVDGAIVGFNVLTLEDEEPDDEALAKLLDDADAGFEVVDACATSFIRSVLDEDTVGVALLDELKAMVTGVIAGLTDFDFDGGSIT